jgi:hypothetical protein
MGVRVSAAERARLESKAAAVGVPVTAFLRLAADAVVPRAVPQVNREHWTELAHLARTLGRLERALAGMRTPLLPAEVLAQLEAFRPVVSDLAGGVFALRNALLGRDPTGRPIRYPDDAPGDVAADRLVLDAVDDAPESGPDSEDAGGAIGTELPLLDVPARVPFPSAPSPTPAPIRGGAVPALVPEPVGDFAPGAPSLIPLASDGTATQTPEVGADARS